MERKINLLLAFFLLSVSCAFAQKLTVKGTVLDETGQTIIGATVREKGVETNGTATNMDGQFTLTVNQGATIVVSYVGYKTQEVKATAQMTIKMIPDSELLDEVMVVAFGTAKKESFTGSAVVVDSKSLEKSQATDAVKALEGVVPGLQISNNTGAPGAGSTIRIRGIGSINASAAPLIILNGAPYDGNINSINPRDIESINVLKDAASAALYGARGANGVIIITTKGGKEGLTQVSVDARYGVNQRGVPEYDIIRDPGTFYETYWDAIRNSIYYSADGQKNGITLEQAGAQASAQLIDKLGYNIYSVPNNAVVLPNGKLNPDANIKYEDAGTFNDWAAILLSPKARQEYNLSLTRGSEKSKTFFSVGYLDDKGYAMNTGFSRLSSRLSYDVDLYKWLSLSAGSQLSLTKGNFGASGGTEYSNVFNFTRTIAPIYPVYVHDAEGKLVRDAQGNLLYDDGAQREGVNGARSMAPDKNLIGETELDRDSYKRLYLTENVRADVDLTHGFKFNTTFTYNMIQSLPTYFKNPIMGDGKGYGGKLDKSANITNSINWNQVLTYDFKVSDFTGQAMLGHEIYSTNYEYISGSKKKTLDPKSTEFNTYAQPAYLRSGGDTYRVEGYFGQFVGNYKDKYHVSASLRRDGSSIFAPNRRWGTFWSAGASWNIDKEDFMSSLDWLNSLKLRASIGQQGNDYLMDNDGYRMMTPYQDLYSVTNDGISNALSPAYKGNPDITWEKNLNISAGLEFAVLDHRLSGEIDLFARHTSDMLFNEPLSKTTGFTFVPMNLGKMINRGFEFRLDADVVRTDDITWSVGINGSTYRNTILELPERFKEDGLPSYGRILKEGGGIFDYYLTHFVGVDRETGDAQYEIYNKDYNPEDPASKEYVVVGSKGYKSGLKDRQFVGTSLPDLEGGFNTSLRLYGFDLSAQFSYRIGGKMYDVGYEVLMHPGSAQGPNWHKDIVNRWTPENKDARIPRIQLDNKNLINWSDMQIVPASYLSLRNVTLGYTIPRKWTLSMGLQSLRVYATCDNAFVLSYRKGLDPRTSLSGTSAGNLASAIRTISGGLSLTF